MTTETIAINGASGVLWHDGPDWDGKPTGTIGQLEIADPEAGAALLRRGCARLAELGRSAVLAPMEGDTWHAYRSVVESDGSMPFALEPVSGSHDVAALTAAGFVALDRYASSRAPVPPPGTPCPSVAGVRVTPWDGQGAEMLLAALHAGAGNSFADKRFFKPLDRDGFLALYRPLLVVIDPRLIFFAHDDRGLVGFLFGLPDVAQGSVPTQAILKTYASMRRGVGHLLAWHFHEAARDLGYTHVVHALMHDANISLDRSARHAGKIFRRYALFGRQG